jgi:hypothetical protein
MLLLTLCAALLGCSDLFSPFFRAESSEVGELGISLSGPGDENGCATFVVRLGPASLRGARQVTVTESANPDCGQVRPVLAGEATYDPLRLAVRLPLAIYNGGSSPVANPAHVRSSDNLLKVLEGSGADSLLLFLNADSTETGPTANEGLIRYVWRYDEQLPRRDGAAFLAPGDRSDIRWIEIAANPAVNGFRVGVRARAAVPEEWRGRSYVPALPPDSIPQKIAEEIFAEENRVYPTAGDDFFFLRNVIRLYFEEGTPQHLRQEGVDLIGGEVVGGRRRVANGGLYLIRIKDDGTPTPLEEAIERLKTLPYVASAGDFGYFPIEPRYLRPKDGGEWARWQTRPELAQGQTAALAHGASAGAGSSLERKGTGAVPRPGHAVARAVDMGAPGRRGADEQRGGEGAPEARPVEEEQLRLGEWPGATLRGAHPHPWARRAARGEWGCWTT